MADPANPKLRHFTTRRSFVIVVGLLVLTLYLVWAGYGAAPTSLSFLAEPRDESMSGMAHGGASGGMTLEEFGDVTEKFVEDLSLPDGSVRPSRQWTAAMAGETEHEDAAKAGEAARKAFAAEAEAAMAREQKVGHGHDEDREPIDVYLMAMRFSYVPSVLRLRHGVPYRIRMMSMDVNHGASVHTGFAGHIMRRPAQKMVEMVMAFPESGEFMMYCTVYCGLGHGQMKGKIIVE